MLVSYESGTARTRCVMLVSYESGTARTRCVDVSII